MKVSILQLAHLESDFNFLLFSPVYSLLLSFFPWCIIAIPIDDFVDNHSHSRTWIRPHYLWKNDWKFQASGNGVGNRFIFINVSMPL